MNSNGGNQSEVETEKENEAAGSSPSSSSSKRSSASASGGGGGVNNRCRKSPSGVKLSRTKSHHQLTSNQQQWQDLNGGVTFGSMNNLSGLANKPSNEVELDSKSIALLNNYESFVKAVVTTKMTATPTVFEPSHRVVTVCTTRVRSGNRQLVYESDYLCSGTIIEVPNTLNGGRYLIFFDNGVTGYVRPTLVFPILDLAKFPVDRFNLDHMRFIEYYFREYPNRKMIQTRPGQRINIFFDGSWLVYFEILFGYVNISIKISQFESISFGLMLKSNNSPKKVFKLNRNRHRRLTNGSANNISRHSFRAQELAVLEFKFLVLDLPRLTDNR